jgi:FdhD protein
MSTSSANLPAGAVTRRVHRRRGTVGIDTDDAIAAEVPVALAYNGEPFAVMMATPNDIADFALGFTLSEGIVDHADEIIVDRIEESVDGIAVSMTIANARAQALVARRRNLQGHSGCGICGTASVEAVLRTPPAIASDRRFHTDALARALRGLQARQPLNAATGATHAAGFAGATGEIALVREDVGRHNALDKLIGAMAQADIDPRSGFAVVTSRASYEMAMKAAQVGIPLLAAISAPTALAIALADSANLTLVGFLRDDGHAVYTHPQRLLHAGVAKDAAA